MAQQPEGFVPDKPSAPEGFVPDDPTTKGVTVGPALTMTAAAEGGRLATKGALELATNPSVPKAVATAGRVFGGAAPVVGGIASGNPVAAVNGVLGASQGAWAGGKTGWFTGKLLQNMSVPVAKALSVVEPYLQTLNTLGAAQGVTELAQIAEPNRKDTSIASTSDSGDEAHPALLNLLAMKGADAVKSLVAAGVNAKDAAIAYGILKAHVLGVK